MTNFFDLSSLGLSTSQSQLLSDWLTQMQSTYPGYNPSTSNPEYVLANIFASQFADIANLAAAGSDELFRQYGQKLIGLPMQTGTSAAAVATVTAVDTTGYTLPAGTQLTLTLSGSQIAFQTASTLTIPNGSSSGTVTVIGISAGSAANGATNPVTLVSQITWVSSVTVAAPASGGVDQETDDAYLQRLANSLTSMAPRPITATDYATIALNFQPAAGTDQQEVGRATAIDGLNTANASFTVTATSGNPTLTVTGTPFTGALAAAGATITGTDIPASTFVLSSTSSTITMSNNASGSGSGITATVGGTLGNQRTVTVAISDATGSALNSDTLTAVAAYLQALREVNFVVNVISPAYPTVYVTVTVKGSTGYTSSTVQQNVQSAILAYLTPQNFGLPQGAEVGWIQSSTVFASRLSSVIQLAPGVDHIVGGTLKFGLAASPTNTADLVLSGLFPLPVTTTTSVPLSAVTVT